MRGSKPSRITVDTLPLPPVGSALHGDNRIPGVVVGEAGYASPRVFQVPRLDPVPPPSSMGARASTSPQKGALKTARGRLETAPPKGGIQYAIPRRKPRLFWSSQRSMLVETKQREASDEEEEEEGEEEEEKRTKDKIDPSKILQESLATLHTSASDTNILREQERERGAMIWSSKEQRQGSVDQASMARGEAPPSSGEVRFSDPSPRTGSRLVPMSGNGMLVQKNTRVHIGKMNLDYIVSDANTVLDYSKGMISRDIESKQWRRFKMKLNSKRTECDVLSHPLRESQNIGKGQDENPPEKEPPFKSLESGGGYSLFQPMSGTAEAEGGVVSEYSFDDYRAREQVRKQNLNSRFATMLAGMVPPSTTASTPSNRSFRNRDSVAKEMLQNSQTHMWEKLLSRDPVGQEKVFALSRALESLLVQRLGGVNIRSLLKSVASMDADDVVKMDMKSLVREEFDVYNTVLAELVRQIFEESSERGMKLPKSMQREKAAHQYPKLGMLLERVRTQLESIVTDLAEATVRLAEKFRDRHLAQQSQLEKQRQIMNERLRTLSTLDHRLACEQALNKEMELQQKNARLLLQKLLEENTELTVKVQSQKDTEGVDRVENAIHRLTSFLLSSETQNEMWVPQGMNKAHASAMVRRNTSAGGKLNIQLAEAPRRMAPDELLDPEDRSSPVVEIAENNAPGTPRSGDDAFDGGPRDSGQELTRKSSMASIASGPGTPTRSGSQSNLTRKASQTSLARVASSNLLTKAIEKWGSDGAGPAKSKDGQNHKTAEGSKLTLSRVPSESSSVNDTEGSVEGDRLARRQRVNTFTDEASRESTLQEIQEVRDALLAADAQNIDKASQDLAGSRQEIKQKLVDMYEERLESMAQDAAEEIEGLKNKLERLAERHDELVEKYIDVDEKLINMQEELETVKDARDQIQLSLNQEVVAKMELEMSVGEMNAQMEKMRTESIKHEKEKVNRFVITDKYKASKAFEEVQSECRNLISTLSIEKAQKQSMISRIKQLSELLAESESMLEKEKYKVEQAQETAERERERRLAVQMRTSIELKYKLREDEKEQEAHKQRLVDRIEELEQELESTKEDYEAIMEEGVYGSVQLLCPKCHTSEIRVHSGTQTTAVADSDSDGDSDDDNLFLQELIETTSIPMEIKPKKRKKKAPKESDIPNSFKGLIMAKNMDLSGVRLMNTRVLLKTIHDIYLDKLNADTMRDANAPSVSLAEFVYDYMVTKYGLRSLAEQHLFELFASVKANAKLLRVDYFARYLGLKGPENVYPVDMFQHHMSLLRFTLRSNVGGGSADRSITEKDDGNLEVMILRFHDAIRKAFANKAPQQFTGKLMAEVENLHQVEAGRVDFDEAMDSAMRIWLKLKGEVDQEAIRIFEASDVNGDGHMDYEEFKGMIRSMGFSSSDYDDFQIAQMYRSLLKRQGKSEVLDKERFADEARLSGLIQFGFTREFGAVDGRNDGPTTRKRIQTKASERRNRQEDTSDGADASRRASITSLGVPDAIGDATNSITSDGSMRDGITKNMLRRRMSSQAVLGDP